MNSCNATKLSHFSPSLKFTLKSNPKRINYVQSKASLHINGVVFSSAESNRRRIHFANGVIVGKKQRTQIQAEEEEEGGERTVFCEEEEEEEGVGGERNVSCEVEVISWRERRIRAEILVNSDIDSVWNALTDYERLADFIPNLVYSGTIPCPHPGKVRLEQRGLQRALYWQIEARVVLDLEEFPNSVDDGHEIHFSVVDGDFKKFEGKWSMISDPRSSSKSILSYEVNVIPKFNIPVILVERIIGSDLPVNLRALAIRAEQASSSESE